MIPLFSHLASDKTSLMRQFWSFYEQLRVISLVEQWKKLNFFLTIEKINFNFPSLSAINFETAFATSWEFSINYDSFACVIYCHSHSALFIMLLNRLSLDVRLWILRFLHLITRCQLQNAREKSALSCLRVDTVNHEWITSTTVVSIMHSH